MQSPADDSVAWSAREALDATLVTLERDECFSLLRDRRVGRRTADPEPWAEPGPHWIQVVPRLISGRRFLFDEL